MNSDGRTITDDVTPRLSAAILAALVILGVACRIAVIGREPLWADESLTAILVRYPWWSFAFTSLDPTPPLFYWLEKALVPEGSGPAAWRMLSLVAGVATIPLVYWLGRELRSRTAGLIGAGLVAVSAPLVDYSQEARAYALTVAMIAGSAAALAALTGGRLAGQDHVTARRRMLALFALFTALAIFSHFIAMFWVLPALVVLRLAADGGRRPIQPREMIATIAAIAPFLAIEIYREYLYRTEHNSFTWLAQLSPVRLLELIANQWIPFARTGGWAAAAAGAIVVAALLWMARASLAAWLRDRPFQALIVLTLLLQPLGLWLLGELGVPVAMPRTLLPAAMGFAVLLALAVTSLNRRARVLVGIALIGVSLASLLLTGTNRRKESWAGAAAATRNAPFVLSCPNWKTPSYLAQASGDGLVVTSAGDHALIVRQPGDAATWDRLYFERVQRLAYYPMRRESPLLLDPRPLTANRLLFVASECSDMERGAFAKWAGLMHSKTLWASPRVGDAAAIQVEEWQLRGDAPLKLWILR